MANNEVSIRLTLQGITQASAGLKRIQSDFNALRSSVAVVATIGAATGLVAAVKAAIDFADAAGKMAQKTGIAVEQLTALQYAAKLSEISTEQLQAAIKKFSAELIKSGNSTADVETELLKVADTFHNMPDGVYKTTRAVELFGRSGEEMIPFLNQGRDAIKKQADEARLFGIVIGPRFAANADEFNDNLERMKAQAQGLTLQLANGLLPTLIELSERLLRLGQAGASLGGELGLGAEILGKNAMNVTSSWKDYWNAFFNPAEAMAKAEAQVMAQRVADELRKALSNAIKTKGAGAIDPDDVLKGAAIQDRLRMQFLGLGGSMNGASSSLTEFFRGTEGEGIRHGKQVDEINKLLIDQRDKDQLLLQEEELFQASRDDILSKYHQREQDRILAEEKARQEAWQASLQVGSNFFGALADVAVLFGKKGFAAYKAFAIAQAIIDTIRGAQAAYASASAVPIVGPVLGPIAAGVAVVAGAARVAQIASTNPSGYMFGGYTGDGPANQVAGPVHRGEYVFDAPSVDRFGVANLEAMRTGSPSVNVAAPNVTNVTVTDRAQLRELLRSAAGRGEIINIVRDAKLELGFA